MSPFLAPFLALDVRDRLAVTLSLAEFPVGVQFDPVETDAPRAFETDEHPRAGYGFFTIVSSFTGVPSDHLPMNFCAGVFPRAALQFFL